MTNNSVKKKHVIDITTFSVPVFRVSDDIEIPQNHPIIHRGSIKSEQLVCETSSIIRTCRAIDISDVPYMI
jgi:hypothetical protein